MCCCAAVSIASAADIQQQWRPTVRGRHWALSRPILADDRRRRRRPTDSRLRLRELGRILNRRATTTCQGRAVTQGRTVAAVNPLFSDEPRRIERQGRLDVLVDGWPRSLRSSHFVWKRRRRQDAATSPSRRRQHLSRYTRFLFTRFTQSRRSVRDQQVESVVTTHEVTPSSDTKFGYLNWPSKINFAPHYTLWPTFDGSWLVSFSSLFFTHHRDHRVTRRSFQRLNYRIPHEVEVGYDCSVVGYGTMGLHVHIF